MMGYLRRIPFLLLLPTCLVLAPPAAARGQLHAAAPENKPSRQALNQARKLYERAVRSYEAGDYPSAQADLSAAYRLSRLPDLLFNLSRVSEKLGRKDEALSYLETYLKEKPDAPDARDVQKEIDRLRAAIEEAEARKKASEPQVAPALPVPVPVPAPVIEAQPPKKEHTIWSKLPPWQALSLFGGGTAFIIMGAALGGAALSNASTVEARQNAAAPPPFDSSLRTLEQRGRSLSTSAIIFDVIGALALGAGTAWTGVWWYGRRKESGRKTAVAPQGAGLMLVGEF